MLAIANNNADANDTALNLNVQAGEAPMRVNSATKVTNLNADKVDGLDSSQIGREMWAVINADGTMARGSGVSSSRVLSGMGNYEVNFNRNVTSCAYNATLGSTSDGGVEDGEIGVATRGGGAVNGVFVKTHDSAGVNPFQAFHLVVLC